MDVRMAAAVVILALLGIIIRPRHISEAVFALVGAMLMLAISMAPQRRLPPA